MKSFLKLHIVLIFLSMTAFSLLANAQEKQKEQEEDSSLKGQFERLKERSNNYQIYEVIAGDDLEQFWSNVRDSLKTMRNTQSQTRVDLNKSNAKLSELNARIDSLEGNLENTQHMVDRINFAGIAMKKQSYSVMVWVIIAILAALAILLQYRFRRAHKVTRATRRDYRELNEEFEAHKKRTREKETTLKRDLQTQINKVEELENMLKNRG